jgi:ABC-type uncharacterized transport system involved in gliding motility auxiliary subunit
VEVNKKLVTISGILGGLLGIAALIAASIFPEKVISIALLSVFSLIFLLFFFISHYEMFRAFSKKRSTQLGLNSVLMIVLFIFISIVINLIARQYYFRTDMSSTENYSLAPQTVQVVRQLESPIHIRVFGQESSPSFKSAKKLLESYRYFSRNIMYSVIDLDRAPLVAKEYGIDQYDSILVESAVKPVIVYGISEESITNGIIKATRDISKKIYFLTGHGENDILDNGRNGMSRAVSRLRALGYELTTLVLGAVESVPDDADLLVIAGPKEEFSDRDIIMIIDFMERDGKILGLFDPGYDPAPIIGRTGIQMLQGQIVDPASNLGGRDVMVPLVSSYPDTPITRNFTLSSVFPGAAPLQTGTLPDVYEYFTIASTSSESTIVREDKPVSGKGEHIIAAAAGSVSGKDIMIVFGDADFATNAFFDVVGNGNFFLNSVNWILEEGDLISIVPRRDDFIPLYITPQQGKVLFYIVVVVLPLSVFALGFNVWRKRRVL